MFVIIVTVVSIVVVATFEVIVFAGAVTVIVTHCWGNFFEQYDCASGYFERT